MATELQQIIDSLGHRIDRAVAIDDSQFRLIAYNASDDPCDEARAASILARAAPPSVVDWLQAQGVAEAEGPVRLPPHPPCGLASRIYVPIRVRDEVLGYLWIVDADQRLGSNGLRLAAVAAADASLWLMRERLSTELRLSLEREVLRDLISEDDRLRRQAVERTLDADLLIRPGRVDAIVVHPTSTPASEPPPEVRRAMTAALEEGRKMLSPRHSLELIRPDHAILVMVTTDVDANTTGILRLAHHVHEQLSALLSGFPGWTSHLGISGRHTNLDRIHVAYREALSAARAASLVQALGPVASWSQLGVYRLLLQFPLDALDLTEAGAAHLSLLCDSANSELLRTLELFLDCAGNIRKTAELLHIHRGTLYYRLQRIEELLGASLDDGEVRLTLHLLIKLLPLDPAIQR